MIILKENKNEKYRIFIFENLTFLRKTVTIDHLTINQKYYIIHE